MKSTIDFKNIGYLRNGNDKQKEAYEVLTKNKILISLKEYDPILVGTIPINIDLEKSDLDIVCCFNDSDSFKKSIINKFGANKKFKIWENSSFESLAIVSSFFMDGFEIEIFGQSIPTSEQRGYRHMIVEHKLLQEHGEDFRKRIIELKESGLKTEPAFAKLLQLEGDPYEALLELELD